MKVNQQMKAPIIGYAQKGDRGRYHLALDKGLLLS